MLLFYMSIQVISVWSQNSFQLSGKITGENNKPLSGASVLLSSGSRGAVSDKQGLYFIENVKEGKYKIQISFIGYKTLVDTVYINNPGVYNATLTPALLSLHEVVVTDNYAEIRNREESLSIEIVNDDS